MSRLTTALPKFSFDVSKKSWITLGLVLWFYFVISQIPAVWLGYALTRSGDLALSGVTGTIWSGSASLASIKIRQVDHSLGQLTWKVKGWSFLTLKPCAKITTQMDNQQFEGNVCLAGLKAIELRDTAISLPANQLQQLLPLAIDGQLSINTDKLLLKKDQAPVGHAKVSWMGARIYNGANWMTLGGIGADLTGDAKAGISGHLFDVNSPLHLDLVTTGILTSAINIKGGVSMPEPYFREINAAAWMSMFATPQPNDAQGNVVYTLDLNF